MSDTTTDLPLREACLQEAMRIIETDGLEKLSLREVSRRLGVSHQAPYKHFASRDHILASIIEMTFAEFTKHMEDRSQKSDPALELRALGLAYVDYALANPIKYRLMFSASLPHNTVHPEMLHQADRCFALLHDCLSRLDYAKRPEVDRTLLERDAMVIWTQIHGLVTAMTSDAMPTMPISKETQANAISHALMRIDTIIQGAPPSNAKLEELKVTIKRDFPGLLAWQTI
ncbi:MAG: TetR/AcrR family transcriptional regulator [Pseudomonadota bacterium]